MKVVLVSLIAVVLYVLTTGHPVKRSEEDSSEIAFVGERAENADGEETLHKRNCHFSEHKGKYLSGYCGGCSCRDRIGYKFDSLQAAKDAFCKCACNRKCGGITYEPKSKKYTLRRGKSLKDSPSGEISWLPTDKEEDKEDKKDEEKDDKKDKKDRRARKTRKRRIKIKISNH